MKSLILDTSTETAYIALVEDGALIAQKSMSAKKNLSKSFALLVAGVVQEKVDEVVIGAGPGSFTGTRVGIAFAEALAFGWGVPLKRLPSAEILLVYFSVPS